MDGTTQLLARWRDGDETAVHELIAAHVPAVYAMVRARLGDALRQKLDSGDVVQDAILEFLRHGPAVPPVDAEHLRALLARIVCNTICDRSKWFQAARRRMGSERGLTTTQGAALPANAPDPAVEAMRADMAARLRLAMELLAEQDRKVVVMREWQALPFAQIADELGGNEESARGAYRRAVERLRARMAELRTGGLPAALAAAEAEGEGDEFAAG